MDVECATHVQRLDAMQRRALQLVDSEEHQQPAHVTSLEHRRDVVLVVLVVFHKVQLQEVPHLNRLRHTPRPVSRWTRSALRSDELVEVPCSYSRQQHGPHTARTARLWKRFTAATPDMPSKSIASVKLSAYRWRDTRYSPLVMRI